MRHPDDELAERYMRASDEEKEQISAELRHLPAPPAAQFMFKVVFPILLALDAICQWYWIVNYQPDIKLILAVNGAITLPLVVLVVKNYYMSKPSGYNLLADYKARHGHLPPK